MRLVIGSFGCAAAFAGVALLGTRADDRGASNSEQKPNPSAAALGEEVPGPFVPLHPRTAEDRERLEAVRLYVAARSQEDRGHRIEAINLLEQALKKEPDSVAILRRLCGLSLMSGRNEQGMAYARRVIEADPGDTHTLARLINYYARKEEPAAAEALLRKVVDNPNLDKRSAGYLLAERELGTLYAEKLRQPDKAADAFAKVVEGLDSKAASAFTLSDQRRILGEDEAEAYAKFGEVFYNTRRYDLAIRAFRRGMVYAPDDTLLPIYLSKTLLRAGRGDEALATLEPFLKREPQGREPYDLLAEILIALKRQDEILPRLEAAAKADSKNTPLQYILADRYREAGQREKADALYKQLLQTQPDPQGFGALSASLLRDKKYDELIKVLGDALTKPETFEAVKPQIEAIANDPPVVDLVLDAGLKLQEAVPPRLSRTSRQVLAYVANKAKKQDKFLAIQRLVVKQGGDPQAYKELVDDLYKNLKYAEAASVLQELIAKFPAEKNDPRVLLLLAQALALAGQLDQALENAREAQKIDPNDAEALRLQGFILSRLGKDDDAIALYKSMIEKFPDNDEAVKRARQSLSIIYVNRDMLDEGERELEILLEKDPDDAGVNNDLGYLYADRGKNLEKAEMMIRKAVEDEPENGSYLDSLGWVLFKRGKLQEAVAPLEKAVKDPLADATIHDHLGDVYFKLKEIAKAKTAWEQAEKIASKATPPDKRLPEIRKKLESLRKLDLQPSGGGEKP
jgi:tetratricopeptide (TPR) repeat protein